MNAAEMRAALEAAFEDLTIIGDRSVLGRLITDLVLIAQTPGPIKERQKVIHRSLRKAEYQPTLRELDRIVADAERTIGGIEALRRPAIAAFRKAGFPNIINHDLQAARRRAEAARAAKDLLDPNALPGLKRPRDKRHEVVAGMLVAIYEEIYGRHVDQPGQSPGLEKLVGKIFAIMGIRATAKAALRAALKGREELPRKQNVS